MGCVASTPQTENCQSGGETEGVFNRNLTPGAAPYTVEEQKLMAEVLAEAEKNENVEEGKEENDDPGDSDQSGESDESDE